MRCVFAPALCLARRERAGAVEKVLCAALLPVYPSGISWRRVPSQEEEGEPAKGLAQPAIFMAAALSCLPTTSRVRPDPIPTPNPNPIPFCLLVGAAWLACSVSRFEIKYSIKKLLQDCGFLAAAATAWRSRSRRSCYPAYQLIGCLLFDPPPPRTRHD